MENDTTDKDRLSYGLHARGVIRALGITWYDLDPLLRTKAIDHMQLICSIAYEDGEENERTRRTQQQHEVDIAAAAIRVRTTGDAFLEWVRDELRAGQDGAAHHDAWEACRATKKTIDRYLATGELPDGVGDE